MLICMSLMYTQHETIIMSMFECVKKASGPNRRVLLSYQFDQSSGKKTFFVYVKYFMHQYLITFYKFRAS